MAWHQLRWVVLLLALSPFAYYLLSMYCSWEYFHRVRKLPPLNGSFTPPVSILKPVRGLDREAYVNFATFCRLDYPEYELLFAVADADDPVIPVIRKLQQDFHDRGIRLVTDIPQLGVNRKVNNLCRLANEAKFDLLVMSDSDVRVERDYLRHVVPPFADTEVGGVTSFFRGMSTNSLPSLLEGLALATETVPSALVATKMERMTSFAFGWTMATTKRHLAAVGGFEEMVNYHSDDFELGHRLAAHGARVKLVGAPVWMVFPHTTVAEYFRHELRWSIGLRNVRPVGYAGMVLTFGLPWTLLAAAVSPTIWISSMYVLAYAILRLSQIWISGVWGLNDPVTRKAIWLVPIRDAVSFVVWLGGIFSSNITWRGIEYHVKRGLLIPVGRSKPTTSSP